MLSAIRSRLGHLNLSGIFSLVLGAGFAQFLPFILSPFLTRLYPPAEFGQYGFFLAFATLGGVLVTAKYELAIILPPTDGEAKDLLWLCLILTHSVILPIGVLWAMASFLFGEASIRTLGLPDIRVGLLVLYATGIQQTLSYWQNRHKRYKILAAGRIVQSLFTIGLALMFRGRLWGENGLVLGYSLGVVASASLLGVIAQVKDQVFRFTTCWPNIRQSAIRHRRFPGITMPHAFVDAMQSNLVLYFIGFYYTNAAVGLYSFSFRMLKVPLALIGSAVSQVFYRDAAALFLREGNIGKQTKDTMILLGLIAFPIFLPIIFFGPHTFGLIFGTKWIEAGLVLQIIAPWIFMNFILSPVTQVPLILGKQKEWFIITFIENTLIVLVIAGSGRFHFSTRNMFICLSITNCLYTLGMIGWLLRVARKTFQPVISTVPLDPIE